MRRIQRKVSLLWLWQKMCAREVMEMMSKNLQRETREKGREEPTHLLVHCTNGYNSQDEAKPKPSDKCCVGGPVL